MGTSSAYGGPGGNTPLIPSWLDADGSGLDSGDNPDAPGAPADQQDLATIDNHFNPDALSNSNRYQTARSNFTRFVNSGGRSRSSLGRALSGYVSRSAGGARTAARRMGSSRRAGAALFGFLTDVSERGAAAALRALSLPELVGRPIEAVFLGLADYVCPEGGSIDQGIARDAFIETIAELAHLGITDLDGLTADQLQTVFEHYVTHTIEARIYNDIGVTGVSLPPDVQSVQQIEAQLHDFILRAVSDGLASTRETFPGLTQEHVVDFVGQVYEASFNILRALGEAEA
jgi:hypothetical protein